MIRVCITSACVRLVLVIIYRVGPSWRLFRTPLFSASFSIMFSAKDIPSHLAPRSRSLKPPVFLPLLSLIADLASDCIISCSMGAGHVRYPFPFHPCKSNMSGVPHVSPWRPGLSRGSRPIGKWIPPALGSHTCCPIGVRDREALATTPCVSAFPRRYWGARNDDRAHKRIQLAQRRVCPHDRSRLGGEATERGEKTNHGSGRLPKKTNETKHHAMPRMFVESKTYAREDPL